jgi:hypothetical protein
MIRTVLPMNFECIHLPFVLIPNLCCGPAVSSPQDEFGRDQALVELESPLASHPAILDGSSLSSLSVGFLDVSLDWWDLSGDFSVIGCVDLSRLTEESDGKFSVSIFRDVLCSP